MPTNMRLLPLCGEPCQNDIRQTQRCAFAVATHDVGLFCHWISISDGSLLNLNK